jgi:hypothetical protein
MKKPVFILEGGLHTVVGTRAEVMHRVRSRNRWDFLKTAERDVPPTTRVLFSTHPGKDIFGNRVHDDSARFYTVEEIRQIDVKYYTFRGGNA